MKNVGGEGNGESTIAVRGRRCDGANDYQLFVEALVSLSASINFVMHPGGSHIFVTRGGKKSTKNACHF